MVQPGDDDPVFTDRPSPSREFSTPMDCVGDLLMVWDFCSSFGRMLYLWPFSFEDFEKAMCHKDSNLALIVETHAALFRLLIKDEGEYYRVFQQRKRKPKVNDLSTSENFLLSESMYVHVALRILFSFSVPHHHFIILIATCGSLQLSCLLPS